jgi:hypothetical protein
MAGISSRGETGNVRVPVPPKQKIGGSHAPPAMRRQFGSSGPIRHSLPLVVVINTDKLDILNFIAHPPSPLIGSILLFVGVHLRIVGIPSLAQPRISPNYTVPRTVLVDFGLATGSEVRQKTDAFRSLRPVQGPRKQYGVQRRPVNVL